MGFTLDDKELFYYSMDLLEDDKRINFENRLKNNNDLSKKLGLLNTALTDIKVDKESTDKIWDKISAYTDSSQKLNSNIKILKFPKKNRLIKLSFAASFILLFLTIRFFIPMTAGKSKWTYRTYKSIDKDIAVIKSEDNKFLNTGSKIIIDKNKSILLEYKKGTRISFTGPGVLTLAKFQKGKKALNNWILSKGGMILDVDKNDFKEFIISSPHVSIIVTGTRFNVFVNDKATKVKVDTGQVKLVLKNTKKIKMINSGEKIICNSRIFYTERVIKKTLKPKFAEKIFLRDGTVFIGKILSQDNKVIKIKTKHGIFSVERTKIRNVLYK